MKLEKWALIAEIVSSVAVLVTLVFLALGVRDSANVTRAAVYENLMSDINEFNLFLVGDPALSHEWLREDRDIRNMEEEDADRVILLNRVTYRTYEAAYYSFKYGSLGSSQWERFQATICTIRQRADPELWSRTASILTSEFGSYIEENCGD